MSIQGLKKQYNKVSQVTIAYVVYVCFGSVCLYQYNSLYFRSFPFSVYFLSVCNNSILIFKAMLVVCPLLLYLPVEHCTVEHIDAQLLLFL